VLPLATPHTDMPGNPDMNTNTDMNPKLTLAFLKSELIKNLASDWQLFSVFKLKMTSAF
jgi:hypothetical protein